MPRRAPLNLPKLRLLLGASRSDADEPRWNRQRFRAVHYCEVLISVWDTPPSIAEGGSCASPPSRLADYGDFVWQLMDEYGGS
jgi:hypothetical protein